MELSAFYLFHPDTELQRLAELTQELLRARFTFKAHPLVGTLAKRGSRTFGHYMEAHRSHIEALKRCETEYCLVIEDDARFTPSFNAPAFVPFLEGVLNERGSFDLLLLGHDVTQRDAGLMGMQDEMARSVRIQKTACGCHAYVVRRASALVDRVIYRFVDTRIQGSNHRFCVEHLNVAEFRAYLAYPNAFIQVPSSRDKKYRNQTLAILGSKVQRDYHNVDVGDSCV